MSEAGREGNRAPELTLRGLGLCARPWFFLLLGLRVLGLEQLEVHLREDAISPPAARTALNRRETRAISRSAPLAMPHRPYSP